MAVARRGLLERLKSGEDVLVAEGYMFEFARRGYLSRGSYVPEVVLEHPDLVRAMHNEFVHAGSDVVLAFTYYGHRKGLKKIGKEDDVTKLNKQALQIAREVAYETGSLFAGGICHTRVYDEDDPKAVAEAREMFKEMIQWAVEAGTDYIIGETFDLFGEAMLALDCIKMYGKGQPAVITLVAYCPDMTVDGVPIPEACRRLEEAGAAVVGINCARGPKTMIPLLKEIRTTCKGPIAALPVTFRCYENCRTFYNIKDSETGKNLYPSNLESARCNSEDITKFGEEAKSIGVQYIGLCCGNCALLMRDLAESYGRSPEACRYSIKMELSEVHGEDAAKINRYSKRTKEFMAGLV